MSRRLVLDPDGTSASACAPNRASVMPARRALNGSLDGWTVSGALPGRPARRRRRPAERRRSMAAAMTAALRVAPEVAEALAGGTAVVALESTLIAHGLPRGRNLE